MALFSPAGSAAAQIREAASRGTLSHALLFTGGQGSLTCGGETREVKKGQCWFLPAGSGEYQVTGDVQTLDAYLTPQ